MSEPEVPIPLAVDLTNPGQFFACCGLLELADRLWPTAEVRGAFKSKYFELVVGSEERTLKQLLNEFIAAEVKQIDDNDNAASPVHVGRPFNLRLDWWKRVETPDKRRVELGGGDQLKTWAGRQLGPSIFRLMKNACVDISPETPFNHSKAVYDAKGDTTKQKTVSPFYFDARRDETSLDIGFSPDEQDMSVMVYPAVEALALVGLQRFRPRVDGSSGLRTFVYTAWTDPLPPVLAMAAVSGALPTRSCGTYRFTKPSRGGEYATMFSRAKRERSNDV